MPNAREIREIGIIQGEEALRLRREGLKLREIAESMGVHKERVHQLIARAKWRELNLDVWGELNELTDDSPWKAARPHLTVRSYNALQNMNAITIGIARIMVAEQSSSLLHIPNFGRRSLEELQAFFASIPPSRASHD